MSLLDRGNVEVILYPEVAEYDADGNIRTRASSEGVPIRVSLQPQGQSGTAARRAEQHQEGYETEKVMRMRVRRKDAEKYTIGAQSKIEFQGNTWSVFGDAIQYLSSPRTAHNVYHLRRS